MPDSQDSENEVAATSSGYDSKRYVTLIRFVSVLIDQTAEANLSPDEMRFVAAIYRNSMELIANNAARR